MRVAEAKRSYPRICLHRLFLHAIFGAIEKMGPGGAAVAADPAHARRIRRAAEAPERPVTTRRGHRRLRSASDPFRTWVRCDEVVGRSIVEVVCTSIGGLRRLPAA